MAIELKIRLIVIFMIAFGLFLNIAIRNVTNVTLVALSNSTAYSTVHFHNDTSTNTTYETRTSKWDHKTRNTVTAWIWYGSIILQLPAGRLSETIGSRYMLGPAVGLASMLCFIFPYAVQLGVNWACGVRFIQGLLLGVCLPASNFLVSSWAPINERSTLMAITFIGSAFGTVITEALSGVFSSLDFLGGWPLMYYLIGFLGAAWLIAWLFLVYDKPEDHPMISQEEIAVINDGRNKQIDRMQSKLPIKRMLLSLPVHSWIWCGLAASWRSQVVMYQQPEYMNAVLDMDVENNGILSSAPHIALVISSFIFAYICDRMRETGKFSITYLRNSFNFLGTIGSGICMILIPLFGANSLAINMLFILTMIFAGSLCSGYVTNHLDMAPSYAGTLMGVSNFISNSPGFLLPAVASAIVGDSKDVDDWAKLFYLTGVISILGGVIYLIGSDCEVQPWDPESVSEDVKKTNIDEEAQHSDANHANS
ncbi:putative inorganic phosphate cotransporter [Brevipalpus obovatus]|uniref:putative inorganic phosphate cotransporter n=1 Tax=Brevipalpus obovatus TaxID=246614 RepID=UPI003D9F953B